MKKQVFNPYLPSYEYIPDGEPRVFNGRLHIYGSHDKFNGDVYCQNDYVCWPDGRVLGTENDTRQFDPGIFIDDDERIYLFFRVLDPGNY